MDVDMNFIPDAVSGEWAIETFTVSGNELSEKIQFIKTGRYTPRGTYKKLVRGSTLVMSNTPDEIRDFSHMVNSAHGNILINGLGLGCLVRCLLGKSEVSHIKVIEKSEDVISLISPYFRDDRLEIIHADAFEYKPPRGEKYDFVWHDIWDYITSENLKEMNILHKKYGRRTKWQDSWCRSLCKKSRY